MQYDKDTTVTFSYETDAKRGNLCFSLYEEQGEKIKELKENKKYTFNISGLKVKDGFVKVDWKEE